MQIEKAKKIIEGMLEVVSDITITQDIVKTTHCGGLKIATEQLALKVNRSWEENRLTATCASAS